MENNNIIIEEVNSNIQALSEKAGMVRKELETLCDEINKLKEKKSDLLFGFEPTLEKIMEIADWREVQGNAYTQIHEYLCHKHPYIYQSGCWADTAQIAFAISKHNNPGKDYAKIEYLLSLIRPNNNGKKCISILDSECSANGVWTLVNGTTVERTLWGRTKVEKEFDTVGEALEWIYGNLFQIEQCLC